MRQEQWEGKIVPAQLSFLAIYSPPLGMTDETFKDQVVFYYSREAREARSNKKKSDAGDAHNEALALREEQNEKLRQIGLAQGMVDFARSFSDGKAVDSVDTEKSRIILHELEHGWWILASIDLTRLPSVSLGATKPQRIDNTAKVEYSSREVSPAPLLLQQVLTAHRVFLLHHGPSLNNLYRRSTNEKFRGILDRFWTRFCRNWEVLLHGSPAVDVFGGLKLAAGGELGMGVGEEEWGSGEREVLEDLVRQTEGMVDLTVSRFGHAAPPERENAANKPSDTIMSDPTTDLPWLGCGHLPEASDGVVFGGNGAISRNSLRDVSSWVQDIYTYGEHAYGVKDNPQRERRKRRRRQPPPPDDEDLPTTTAPAAEPQDLGGLPQEQGHQHPDSASDRNPETGLPVPLPRDPRPQTHDRVASHDHATGTATPQIASHPGIPPPIVTAAEESLNAAALAAGSQKEEGPQDKEQGGSRFGMSDKWMKYLTLGLSTYASGPEGRPSSPSGSRPQPPLRKSSSSIRTLRRIGSKASFRHGKKSSIAEHEGSPPMQTLDPCPENHELHTQITRQQHQENHGHFLIGYMGDLEKVPSNETESNEADSASDQDGGERTLLRTLQIEMRLDQYQGPGEEKAQLDGLQDSDYGGSDTEQFRRLRVLVYVCRPFVYTFLFEQRAPVLQMASFYAKLHAHIRPLHRPLLRSTSPSQVAQRIADAHTSPPSSINTENPPYAPSRSSPVFDLVYDPLTLTIHTSIPNIPDPGTPAAEGIATTSTGRSDPPLWTRLEAINVHSQILNTLIATEPNRLETERTSKTSRGWWVVWMRIPSAPTEEGALSKNRYTYDQCRTAFLVRKASDQVGGYRNTGGRSGYSSRVTSGMGGMFGFGGNSYAAAGDKEDSAAASVGWGLGIDARKYVEGLLSLNR